MQYILQLNNRIDLDKIRKSIKDKNKFRTDKKNYDEEQEVIYTILHEFSNYDEVIWSLYKTNDRKLIHNQLQFILVEISKLDPSLTWACMKVLKRYKDKYNQHKKQDDLADTFLMNIYQIQLAK